MYTYAFYQVSCLWALVYGISSTVLPSTSFLSHLSTGLSFVHLPSTTNFAKHFLWYFGLRTSYNGLSV